MEGRDEVDCLMRAVRTLLLASVGVVFFSSYECDRQPLNPGIWRQQFQATSQLRELQSVIRNNCYCVMVSNFVCVLVRK